jgi:asparagine synthase (glutamine-hydrolysing)
MCGFTGLIDLKGLKRSNDIEKKMDAALRRLYSRGPDQQDRWNDEHAYLVHSRLSIIDTSYAGKQPMVKYNKALVYNGEIYNFKELRKKLIQNGYNFTSSSDCEVLLAGWDFWREKLLNLIDGMFAFAIWDFNLNKLILARDPFGKKPLLYTIKENKISFSSDLKSLEKIIDNVDINTEAVDSLFRFRFIHEPITIYKQVNKVPPGHILEFKNNNCQIRKWYNLPLNSNLDSNKTIIKNKVIDLFDKAVNKRLISDVPLGVLLSGGLDSSLIISSLAEHGKSLSCYTMGFENTSSYYEERPEAKRLAEYYGMKHSNLEISSRKLLNIVPEVFDASDEPFADSSALPFFALSKEVSKNVTVALSGDGGDEVFGGYRKYIGEKWSNLANIIPLTIRKFLISILIENKDTKYGELSRRLRRFLYNASSDEITRHINWLEQLNDREILSLLGYNSDSVRSLFMDARGGLNDKVNAILFGDLNISLPGDMLVKLDRMSMANSLEIRSPFLDKELVEYAFTLSGNIKVGNFKGKTILREAFAGRIPKWSMNLPKKGFEVPIANWLQKDLKNMLEHVCLTKNLDKIGIKDHAMVQDWKNLLFVGKRDTSWKLWTLISYYHWSESKGFL